MPATSTDTSRNVSSLDESLSRLDSGTRSELGIDAVAALADGMFAARRWAARGTGVHVLIVGLLEAMLRMEDIEGGLKSLEDTQSCGWITNVGHHRRQYLLKRFGTALIHRIERSARDDLDALKRVFAVLLSDFGPVIDAIAMASTISKGSDPTTWQVSVGTADTKGMPQLLIEMCGNEHDSLVLASTWPALVTELFDEEFQHLSPKYAGARWVLDNDSPDAISQAANSVVELLDHFLRSDEIKATEEEITHWCIRMDASKLLFDQHGVTKPTKRGRFAYVFDVLLGRPDADAASLRDTLSLAAVGIRTAAEKLKHEGTNDDRPAVEQVLRATEALFVIVHFFRSAWSCPSGELEDYLRQLDERLTAVVARRHRAN